MPPLRLAPLAPLALLLASAAPARPAERIDVALTNFKITPATIQLKANHAYVLHFTSAGSHSFEAKAFFAAAKLDPNDRIRMRDGRIELDAGQTTDIHFTAPGPGSFPTRCTHFLHAGWGMKGTIVVT